MCDLKGIFMGKDSLIKSTSKKKSQTKKEEAGTKKQPAKKAAAKISKPAKITARLECSTHL